MTALVLFGLAVVAGVAMYVIRDSRWHRLNDPSGAWRE